MPNHYHFVVKEVVEGGISKYMQKLGTGYTMYFNTRYCRTGSLFTRPFRARHIKDDEYLQKVVGYVHMNPAELIEPGWKHGWVKNIKKLKEELTDYPNSSLKDYIKQSSPTRRIIGNEIFDVYQSTPISKMLDDAHEYYKTIGEPY
jgi:putative transposase